MLGSPSGAGSPGLAPGDAGPDPIEVQQQRSLDRLAAAADAPYFDADADARDRDCYYADVDCDADASTLGSQLTQLVATTHVRHLPYGPSEQLYPWVDLQPDGHLRNIYSGIQVDPGEVIREDARIARERTDRLSAALRSRPAMSAVELQAAARKMEHVLHFNCEHVVPQSWFDHREPMRGDLHHLFTCEPTCNARRANIPYAQLSEEDTGIQDCGRLGGDVPGFEPLAGKGAAARATMYFVLRYPGSIGDRASELQPAALALLVAWHEADPVGVYEQHRNAAIFAAQGNRNPFIDVPDLASSLDLAGGFGREAEPGGTPPATLPPADDGAA